MSCKCIAIIYIEGFYNFANHLNLNLSGVNSFIKCLTLMEMNLSEEFPCIVVSRSQNKMWNQTLFSTFFKSNNSSHTPWSSSFGKEYTFSSKELNVQKIITLSLCYITFNNAINNSIIDVSYTTWITIRKVFISSHLLTRW